LADWLKLLCPAEHVESVVSIDVAKLKERRISALLLDLDNTLVPWQSYDVAPEIEAWISEAARQGMKFCIVSNTRTPTRLQSLAAELGLPFVRRGAKPRRGGFREALSILGAETAHAAVIGDQIFTDILGGNRLGLYTILVRPLHPREFVGTKVSRFFERLVLRLLERRGMLKQPAPSVEQSAETDRQMNTEQ